MKGLKPFKIDGEEFVCICHAGSAEGPLIIDVMMNTLTTGQAKKLAAWLLEAVEEVNADKRKRHRTYRDANA